MNSEYSRLILIAYYRCSGGKYSADTMNDIMDRVKQEAETVNYELMGRKLHYLFELEVKQVNGGQNDRTLDIGKWTAQSKMVFQADFKNITLPKLFRIGKNYKTILIFAINLTFLLLIKIL